MTNLGELLSKSSFRGLTLLTNHTHEDMKMDIASIEVTETPDVALHIPENVVLLTTAMIYRDKQGDMINLINSLQKKNVVALGVKTSRFIGAIEQEVLDYANKVDFPIFDIPNSYSIGTLLHQMTNHIWDTQREEILFALDIQEKFSDLLFSDARLSAIIQQLGKIITAPVILLDHFMQPVAESRNFHDFKLTHEEIGEQLFEVTRRKNKGNFNFSLYNQLGHLVRALVIPINNLNRYPSYLVVLSPELMPYPISEFAIDQAGLIISFALYKLNKIFESSERIKTNHFYDMISSLERDDEADNSWMSQAPHFNLVYSNFYQVIRLDIRKDDNSTTRYLEDTISLIGQWLDKNIEAYIPGAVTIQNIEQNGYLLFLQQKNKNFDEKLLEIHEEINNYLNIPLVFSAGLPVENLEELDESFIQAKLTFEERDYDLPGQIIKVYENTGATQLFSQINASEARYFCNTVLKELAFPTEHYLLDLRNTLDVYLGHQCEITTTADHLFIHRNTVKYRIERCEDILQKKVDVPENSLNLRLALTLSERLNDHQ